ncbi:hypothetical protein AVL59_06790 [Streptomyces griseochromogenes]|uniref:Uncharacterized protein n=1 Tax=Streptomyces griseochromogenes TaxID=68214 RepID=A0A1B1AS16_9ACTN|nr:hypothetical protein AVL59_06790 [Streptomyces griseochromogenes]
MTISDKAGHKSFFFEAKPDRIKITTKGGGQHFPVGFSHEVMGILKGRTSRLHRALPPPTRRILDWCLPVEGVLAVTAILLTSLLVGWVAAVSATCASVIALLVTCVTRRHFTTYILLTEDAREPWRRAEKLTLLGMAVPIVVALIVNVPNWVKDDAMTGTPRPGATSGGLKPEATASRRATAASRDIPRTSLSEITVKPAAGRAGGSFVLSGKGFEPGSDVWVRLEAGQGVKLPQDKIEHHLVRVNDRGEIEAEKIALGRDLCCSGGTIKVVAVPDGSTAETVAAYKLR